MPSWKRVIVSGSDAHLNHITASGNVSSTSTSTGSFGRLEITNTITGSNIFASGDVIAFNSSDERYKYYIRRIMNPLEKINKIGGYTYNWNDKQSNYEVGSEDVGVIAQELQDILPQVIKSKEGGYLGVKYDGIIPLLIEGIREQNKRIDKLEKTIEKLKK